MRLLVSIICTIVWFPSFSQLKNDTEINGRVVDKQGQNIAAATISLAETGFQTQTDKDGKYVLPVQSGGYELVVSAVGYITQQFDIIVKKDSPLHKDVTLYRDEERSVGEVVVTGRTALTQVRESPFNVVALDATNFYNSNLDLGHMLDKASGVKIRESGGVGSDLSVTLNGFTGRYVKIFMDGVPMNGFGSSFQLNNIPVNIAERIEVYKGVVPIEFGTDAIGGVINIVTRQSNNSYVDASYSYGSFNTHRSNLNVGHTTKNGFTFQINGIQNYSDNDYKVKTYVLNTQTGNFSSDKQWVKRFNDAYRNESIVGQVGFVNRPWADRFLVGLTLAHENAEIQNANNMQVAFGKRERNANSVIPSISYQKKNLFVDNLNVSVNGTYSTTYNQNIDTAARQYSWDGTYRVTGTRGESVNSLAEFTNENASAIANINYLFHQKHRININNVWSTYRRNNNDPLAFDNATSPADTMERGNFKNILGLEYRYEHNKHWVTSAFSKLYNLSVTGPIDTSSVASRSYYVEQTRTFGTTGYGIASTYFWKDLQFKVSYEKAYRLPNESELFGDEVLEVGNASLRPESSNSFNLGTSLNTLIKQDHHVYVDVSLLYKDVKDYIRRVVNSAISGGSAGTASSVNHGKVRNIGIDTEIRYDYKNKFSIGGNFTYQNIRNRERYARANETVESNIFKDRLPNMPYVFGNGDATYYIPGIWGKSNLLSIGYTLNYVHDFFLRWPSNGSLETKDVVPQQLSHDASIGLSVANGRYNVSLEARNFTNELLYDNFSLQRPGRNISLKLRYYLTKNH